MKKNKVFTAVLLIILLVFSNISQGFDFGSAEAGESNAFSCTCLLGSNEGTNDYIDTDPMIYSYLVPVESGFMRVQGNVENTGISVSYYDFDYNIIERREIPAELPLFGGFKDTASAFFIVSAQTNPNENDSVEVFRITKYDRNWNRVASCSLYGANTVEPFRAGSCKMDMDGQYLVVRTCHTMYKISDGLNHQANLTIMVDTSSMTVTDSFYKISNEKQGYASHSFNQFVKFDNHILVGLDHGDGYPRSFCLMKYSQNTSNGKFQSKVTPVEVMKFYETGYNSTNSCIGGFEISGQNYLIAGNSAIQDEIVRSRKTRNIFVAVVNRSTLSYEIKWLTSYPEGEATTYNPHLVKINDDRFMILWEKDGLTYYALLDGSGNYASELRSMEARLSDCFPIVYNGKVIWYSWNNEIEKFYEIPVDFNQSPSIKTFSYDHDFVRMTKDRNDCVVISCRKCGMIVSGYTVSGFNVFWRKSWENSGSTRVPRDIQKEDVIKYSIDRTSGYSNAYSVFYNMIMEAEDSEHCIIDSKERTIRFTEGGEYKIKVYPQLNPEIARIYTLTVYPLPDPTPVITPDPVVTETPVITPEPIVTETPVITPDPNVTVTPVITVTPNVTDTPTVTVTPVITVTPMITVTPEPNVTNTPYVSPIPVVTPEPVNTQTPTFIPIPSESPDSTPVPLLTEWVSPTPEPTDPVISGPVPSVTLSPEPADINTGDKKETRFTITEGKVSANYKVIKDGFTDESDYTGIKNNKLRIISFMTERNTAYVPKYLSSYEGKYYITAIGTNFLGGNTSVTRVKLGSRVTTIDKKAFAGMQNIKKIYIYAARLKKVGKGAFEGIYSKAKFILSGTEEQCEKAEALIRASGVGDKVKFIRRS